MQSVSPVFTDEEVQFEREIAKNQPQYLSVIGLPVTLRIIDQNNPANMKDVPDWGIAIRFRLTPEERAQVEAGLDLVVTQLTFGKPLAPMNLQFCPAKTKPLFELRDEPPASDPLSNIVQMPRSELTDGICPSCGRTDKTEPAACANQWHQEGVEIIRKEPAEDQPQSEV